MKSNYDVTMATEQELLAALTELDKSANPPARPLPEAPVRPEFKPHPGLVSTARRRPSIRRALLEDAAETIDGARAQTYGGPEDSFGTIATLWQAYLDACRPGPLAPVDVAAMMALLKIARVATTGGSHRDSWLDLAGYAACGAECAEREKREKVPKIPEAHP